MVGGAAAVALLAGAGLALGSPELRHPGQPPAAKQGAARRATSAARSG